MAFEKHHKVFKDFICFTAWREKYNRELPKGAAEDTFPVDGFLERLKLEDAIAIATIFQIGALAGGDYRYESKEDLFEHYQRELFNNYGATKSKYVDFLLGWSGTCTDEYTFIRGLEEFGIDVGITCSKQMRYEDD